MKFASIEKARSEARAKLKAMTEKHRQHESDMRAEIEELNRQETLLLNGVDLSKIMLGEHVLHIKMSQPIAGDDRKAIANAISDLAGGAQQMRTGYFGTKNYDRWYHQDEGHTRYGYGPKHGSIVFAIRLNRPHVEHPRELTAEEIDAAIYLLKMLELGKYLTPNMHKEVSA